LRSQSLLTPLAKQADFGYHCNMGASGENNDSARPMSANGDNTGALPILRPAAGRRDPGGLAEDLTARAQELAAREQQVAALEAECRERVRDAEATVSELQRQVAELSARLETRDTSLPPPVPDNLVAFAPRRTPDTPVDELVSSLRRAADVEQPAAAAGHGPLERIAELEHDLQAAEDQIHTLEAELRYARGQDSNAESDGDEMDPTATAHISEEALAEGPARFLALIDGDTEILHRLTRRVTIGRAADNDIQVEARFVSRYHAAVMAGPSQTVIEDLGSTNGLLVNGRRVSRHLLRDGDVVRIGKSRFRFMTRPR
jgi:phage shock protein A